MDVYAIVTEKIINMLEQGRRAMAQAVDRRRIAAQCREQEAISRDQSFSAFSVQVRAAVLVDHAAGERTGRTGPQRRGEHDHRFLEDGISTRRDRAHERNRTRYPNLAAALSSAIIVSGTSSSASYRNAPSKSCRRLKPTSTIRSKR